MAVALDLTADAPARVLKQHCQTLRAEPGPADASPAPPSSSGRAADSSTGVSGPNFNRLTDAERVFTRQRSQGFRVCWSWGPSRPQTPWSAPGGRGDLRMTGWVCGSTLDECNGRESASVRHAPAVVSRSASTSRSGASHPRSGPSGLGGSGCHTFRPPSSHCGTRHVRRPTASTAASHELPGCSTSLQSVVSPLPKSSTVHPRR
jgi:hypothetical protein